MSRHRFVKGMLDEYYDEQHDEEDEGEYYEDDYGKLSVQSQEERPDAVKPKFALKSLNVLSGAAKEPVIQSELSVGNDSGSIQTQRKPISLKSLSLQSVKADSQATTTIVPSVSNDKPLFSLKSLIDNHIEQSQSVKKADAYSTQLQAQDSMVIDSDNSSTTTNLVNADRQQYPSEFAALVCQEVYNNAPAQAVPLAQILNFNRFCKDIDVFKAQSKDDKMVQARLSTKLSRTNDNNKAMTSAEQKSGLIHNASNRDLSIKGINEQLKKVDLLQDKSLATQSSQSAVKVVHSTKKKQKNKMTLKDVLERVSKEKKPHINLVIIGHVDAGKSTLMGHLLYLLGEIDAKTMHKYERDSQKMGKGSFKYAWVMDEGSEERERGVTIDVAYQWLETDDRVFTLLDAPGHRDFIPNMISGTAQADAAILVVDAGVGQFEAGFLNNGQTKEHALLARSLGVSSVIVAVNKMDTVDWDVDRFQSIKEQVHQYLTSSVGFKSDSISYCACSGMTGENVLSLSAADKFPSQKQSLVQLMNQLEAPVRTFDKPFRFTVYTIAGGLNIPGSSGAVSVSGRIEQGYVQVGEDCLLLPGGISVHIKSIFKEPAADQVDFAVSGDSVRLSFGGVEENQVSGESVLCSPTSPVSMSCAVEVQILTFDIKIPVILGSELLFHRQSINEPVVVTKLINLKDKSTGEITKQKPRAVPKQSIATVELKLKSGKPIAFEPFKTSKEYGRFMLRSKGETVAAGIVVQVL
ncbi:hypothetical protein MIR68_003066 [Amoeboaphelidium protococcarum]|nr:hypothetical protein MIR68_003066 [Amoeboaphelidium protococcarum]